MDSKIKFTYKQNKIIFQIHNYFDLVIKFQNNTFI